LNCHCCSGNCRKSGSYRNKNRIVQRYACDRCGKSFSESQPLQSVCVDFKQSCQVIQCFAEGLGVRATCRLTRLNKKTVLKILCVAGDRCADLLDQKILNVKPEPVEIDECWTFVKNKRAMRNTPEAGDFYAFLASGRDTKLILSWAIGKRDKDTADAFMVDVRSRINGEYQITSDSWRCFIRSVLDHCSHKAHYATQVKRFDGYQWNKKDSIHRYSFGKCVSIKTRVHCGNPDPANITTSHAERLNGSLRHFNKRFTRLSPCFSRKVENLAHSVALTVAYFNFCRVHSAHKLTPAQAAGITDHKWTIEELLSAQI
jgi:IS1 family transposase/transposase-like protein